MNERKKIISQLLIGIFCVVAGLMGVNAFNQYLLMSLPIGLRMVLMIGTYWLIAIVPFCIMIFGKDKLVDYGFVKERIGLQVLIGVLIGVCMSCAFTLLPHLAGKSDWVNNGHNYQYWWQFAYDFLYFTVAIGLVEEFVFRGFAFHKIEKLTGSTIGAVIGSSILFGLFHFLGGNIMQLFWTGIIGLVLCTCRMKIKNCTLISLIIAHGVYDALITVWLNVFN